MVMPVVAIKGLVMLPGMLVHFDLHQDESVSAINAAMKEGRSVLIVAQREGASGAFSIDDMYEIGTISAIKQMIKMPGNVVRVLAQGQRRGHLLSFTQTNPYLEARVGLPYETNADMLPIVEQRAMIRTLKDILEEYFQANDKIAKELSKQLMSCDSLDALINQIAISVPMMTASKQKILEAMEITERFRTIAVTITNEIEVLKIKKDLQGKVRDRVDKNQKDESMREQMKVIREELGEKSAADDADEYLETLETLVCSETVKEKIKKEIDRFKNLSGSQAESVVSRTYIETLLSLPWDKMTKDNLSIINAKEQLDKDHYGLDKVKERILEFLSVRILNSKGQAPIICLVGPPGTGKTSIARSVATALNKKYVRICLGGVRDEAEIRGHRKTYIGAMPGRIISGLKEAGTKNPLMLLDEIDKVSSDYKGDTSSALLEVLDPEQNKHFADHYVEIPVDLSEVFFICTANSTKTIPRPLLDRMEVIEVNSYTDNEKIHIAKDFLYPKQLEKNGLKKTNLKISDGAIRLLIAGYTREAGVRSLERRFGELCRKAGRKLLEEKQEFEAAGGDAATFKPSVIKVTDKNLKDFLGKQKFHELKANAKAEVGIVRGLAWTEVGGDTLQIEVNTMPGKGELILTGSLGDVMKESARIALSYVRSISEKLNLPEDYFDKNNIHVHVPAGATPKDGPSAGITMTTAIYSAISGIPVRNDIAMTGEVSLRGKVMPIGGLKEKLLAANKAGMKTVLVPVENEPDLAEISEEITAGMEVIPVSEMKQVLKYALAEVK
ncbi:MAG: endopeptidase La [Lachnospiraceae bacterium]|nr:endopeptidase La [Lachnospiraceae bacterium]